MNHKGKAQEIRNEYANLAVGYIPHLMGLIDRNPYSPTYGCFDREYWHYKTRDFPCGMSQEFVLPLALAYATDFPENRWYGEERIKELAIAGIEFAKTHSHSDGTCDDYYPWERAMGALAFSTYACTETYQILGLSDESLERFFALRGEHLLAHNESGRLSNHQALAALALFNIYQITGNEIFKIGAQERIDLVLSWQHSEEGWFQEYEGADPGYQTCTIDFLAKYFQKTGDRSLLPSLERAVEFAAHFIHPDGSYGGEYGSRNSYHFYPHGFEILALEIPLAAQITNAWLRGVQRGKRYYNDDDRMIGHLSYNFIQAWADFAKDRPEEKLRDGHPFIRWYEGAGILVVSKPRYYAVSGMKKGGVLKVYSNSGCLYSDTGLIGSLPDGKVLVSHLQDEKNVVDASVENESFVVEGCFAQRSTKLASPFRLIIFRVLNISFGRFFPNLLRRILQKILITGKFRTNLKFKRVIRFSDDHISITDQFPPGRFARLSVGSDATSIYVAASNVYQDSILNPWLHADENILNKSGEFHRRITPEG